MSKYRLLWLILLVGFAWAKEPQTVTPKYLKIVYHNAIHDFRIGSYYEALDEFSYLTKFPDSPYYLPSLFMLANTYLYIGKRTGEKRYLWAAQNYLNTYLAKGGKKDANYYYLKANILENLGFYERAMANYEIALTKAQKKRKKLKVLMGLLRSAVQLHKMDMATRYLLILSIESLQPKAKKELDFLRGMFYFAQKDYTKALKYFRKTYKEFESFLIENPEYYYLVAETAYRYGDLQFANQLFRRILNYVKNKEVLQKALLRLGDIKFLEQEYQEAAAYYIRLIKNYPNTKYAVIAKLKLLYLVHENQKLRFYIKKYMPEASFLKDPQKFVVTTLVKNRNNYLGLFALANFGMIVFDLDADSLYKRLEWEISLVAPGRLEYEHIEYFRRLWREYLLHKLPLRRLCGLYSSNPDFFFKVFRSDVLLRIAKALKNCKKEYAYLRLLKKLAVTHNKESIWLTYAKALYEAGKYEEAQKALEHIVHKDCIYYKLYAALCFMQDRQCPGLERKLAQTCGEKELYTHIFRVLASLPKQKIPVDFLKLYKKIFSQKYATDPVVKKFVQLLAKQLLEQERYADLIDLLGPIAKNIEKDCFLNGILSLSYIRLGKIKYAQEMLSRSKECNSSWYILAKNALEDAQVAQKAEGM